MADVNCQLEDLSSGALTVGKVFHVYCEGQIPKLDSKSAELRLDTNDKYKLKMIGLDSSKYRQLKLDLVSYQVGEHKIPAVQLVDSEHSIVLGDLNFTVKSVMDPQKPMTEPYGPMILKLMWPLEYWVVLMALFLILLTTTLSLFVRRFRYQSALKKLKLDQYQLSPYRYFQQQVKFEIRNHPELGECLPVFENQFDLYLSRLLNYPVQFRGPRKTKSYLLLKIGKIRNSEIREKLGKEVAGYFAELSLAQKKWDKYEFEQRTRFYELMKDLVEKLEKHKKEMGL